jgi:hypothetical protein
LIKPDYKKLYEACQDGCNRLRIERNALQRNYEAAVVKAEMPKPHDHNHKTCPVCADMQRHPKPTIDHIVVQEKEVLPWWVRLVVLMPSIFWVVTAAVSYMLLSTLSAPLTPARQPYPVYITKFDQSYADGFHSCMRAFNDCHIDYCRDHPRLKGCRS